MRMAMADAGIEPPDVQLVLASANALSRLDGAEAAALRGVFGDALAGLPVCAIKAATGETHAAGGALSAVAAALSVARRKLPPTAAIAPDVIEGVRLLREAEDADVGAALVNAIDVGGACVSLVIGKVME